MCNYRNVSRYLLEREKNLQYLSVYEYAHFDINTDRFVRSTSDYHEIKYSVC